MRAPQSATIHAISGKARRQLTGVITMPARPKIRISARPITKGGVMIGSTETIFSSRGKGNRVRVAIKAKARPSAVLRTPTTTAKASEFQAAPQLRPPVRTSGRFAPGW